MLTATNATRWCGVVIATGLLGSLAACGGGGSSSSALKTVNVWDPYPQNNASSSWAQYLQACAPKGTTLKRTAAAQSDLFSNLTNAVKAGNPPDVVILDNPAVPDAASSGLIAPASKVGMDTSGFDSNLAGPGTVDGVTYGVPIGVNTLGLYYNKDLVSKVGVDPASITSWDALESALAKVKAAGQGGITFSGVAGEEGVFQFLPWFWGSGASLKDPGSADAEAAAQFVSGWLGKGYAPKSAITDNQSQSWDNFLTGKYAFAENGSWFAEAAAKNTSFAIGEIPLPSKAGGAAPVPTGAEFVTAPFQKKDAKAHYANAAKVISCLVDKQDQTKTATELGYFSATKALRTEQIASTPAYSTWGSSIDAAQGRTSDLGAKYTATSAAISTALQTSLNAAGDTAKIKQAWATIGQN